MDAGLFIVILVVVVVVVVEGMPIIIVTGNPISTTSLAKTSEVITPKAKTEKIKVIFDFIPNYVLREII